LPLHLTRSLQLWSLDSEADSSCANAFAAAFSLPNGFFGDLLHLEAVLERATKTESVLFLDSSAFRRIDGKGLAGAVFALSRDG
jgi:hypothetical protein